MRVDNFSQCPFVCLVAWLEARGQKMANSGESFSKCEDVSWFDAIEDRWRLDFKQNHIGEELENGLGVGNGSWGKREDRACLGGWEHMVEYKGFAAVYTVQTKRILPLPPPAPNLSCPRVRAQAPWQAACLLPACLSESLLCALLSPSSSSSSPSPAETAHAPHM